MKSALQGAPKRTHVFCINNLNCKHIEATSSERYADNIGFTQTEDVASDTNIRENTSGVKKNSGHASVPVAAKTNSQTSEAFASWKGGAT